MRTQHTFSWIGRPVVTVLTALTIPLVSFANVACQSQADQTSDDPISAVTSDRTTCRMIEHAVGETEVCGQPQRIVVLGPYVLEPLLALDVQPIAFADHAALHEGEYTNTGQQIPYLGKRVTDPIANVGTVYTPSLEAMVKVQPDLILGLEGSNSAQYETFSKIAPTLLFDYFEIEENLRAIAKAVDRTDRAEKLLAQQQQQIAQARETFAFFVTSHPKVLLLGSSQLQKVQLERGPCSSLIEELGFQRVSQSLIDNAEPNAGIAVSLETLPTFNDADWVIVFGSDFSELKQFSGADTFEDHQLSALKQAWAESAIAQSLNASKAGQVYFIPAYLCRGLPGPIGTELYLEELQKQLLPSDERPD